MAKRKTQRDARKALALKDRTLDARPDTLDFRDKMYVPTLVEVPTRIDLDVYRQLKIPILNQGREGACTGFGLATVVHFLLRTRRVVPDTDPVSPRMLYEMAKRYDEWPGEDYPGSSARGAMKGWHKHGVCTEAAWPYQPRRTDRTLTPARAGNAADRPLGAYFRVNHTDLVAMHSAIAEVGILYATATVHDGWNRVGRNGVIPFRSEPRGGHAFAIVAYEERGFWIQNSWGPRWGVGGCALLTYDDWLEHGTDIWVARLGAPVKLVRPEAMAAANAATATSAGSYTFQDLRPHIISIDNDGRLRDSGTYGTSKESLRALFEEDFPRITNGWKKKRLLLYAHGGLTDEASAVQRVAKFRCALLEAEVYPLAFIWKTDAWTTVKNILQDAVSRRRAEGILDASKEFMRDRLDDALEPLARMLGGKALWDEMKENALLATRTGQGGARIAAGHLAHLMDGDRDVEVHLVGHSAGGIFHAPLVQLLTARDRITSGPLRRAKGYGQKIATCTLWAPACTVSLFKETYLPAVRNRSLRRFALFTLTDEAEQDDSLANIYCKSLLYLVSDALEKEPRVPLFRDGVPILGMEKFVVSDREIQRMFRLATAEWIRSPNTEPDGSPNHSTARHHGDFDDDPATLRATLSRILNT